MFDQGPNPRRIPTSTRRRSIVMVVPAFPDNEENWWLPPLRTFVKAIAARNPDVDVHVVAFHFPRRRRVYTWHGIHVHALAGANKRFPLRFITWMRAAVVLRRLIRTHNVIAIHSHWLAECTYVAAWISRIARVRHIATIHGQDAFAGNPYLRHLPLGKMTITALSEKAAETFLEATGRKADFTIPIGLDADALNRENTFSRSIDIMGVGSLSAIKDYHSFLEIVSELRSTRPDLKCVIIGQGPQQPTLEGYIRDHNLGEIVRLEGPLPRDVVLHRMRSAKILLHTARYEGQGYVFLEALAAGMHVVCRDVGYTGNGTGVHRCDSTSEMARVLRSLLVSGPENHNAQVMSVEQTAAAFDNIYRFT